MSGWRRERNALELMEQDSGPWGSPGNKGPGISAKSENIYCWDPTWDFVLVWTWTGPTTGPHPKSRSVLETGGTNFPLLNCAKKVARGFLFLVA